VKHCCTAGGDSDGAIDDVIDADGAVGDGNDVRVWLSKPPCCLTEEKWEI
jgi:hypothetical protein